MSKKNDLIRSIHDRVNECDRSTRIEVLKLINDTGVPIQEKSEGCSIRFTTIKKNILEKIVKILDDYDSSFPNNQQMGVDEV